MTDLSPAPLSFWGNVKVTRRRCVPVDVSDCVPSTPSLALPVRRKPKANRARQSKRGVKAILDKDERMDNVMNNLLCGKASRFPMELFMEKAAFDLRRAMGKPEPKRGTAAKSTTVKLKGPRQAALVAAAVEEAKAAERNTRYRRLARVSQVYTSPAAGDAATVSSSSSSDADHRRRAHRLGSTPPLSSPMSVRLPHTPPPARGAREKRLPTGNSHNETWI